MGGGLDSSSFHPLDNSTPIKKKKKRHKDRDADNKKQRLEIDNSLFDSSIPEVAGDSGATGEHLEGGKSDQGADQKVSHSDSSN